MEVVWVTNHQALLSKEGELECSTILQAPVVEGFMHLFPSHAEVTANDGQAFWTRELQTWLFCFPPKEQQQEAKYDGQI